MNNFLFTYIHDWASNGFVSNAAIFLNDATYIILLIVLLWAIFFTKRRFFTVMLLVTSSASAWVISYTLKILFHTVRPFVVLGLTPLVYLGDYSFPSEHAAVFSAIAVTMYFINKRAGILLGVLAVLVGVSRIILGVHYPIDVLGGFAIGTLIAILYIRLFKKL